MNKFVITTKKEIHENYNVNVDVTVYINFYNIWQFKSIHCKSKSWMEWKDKRTCKSNISKKTNSDNVFFV